MINLFLYFSSMWMHQAELLAACYGGWRFSEAAVAWPFSMVQEAYVSSHDTSKQSLYNHWAEISPIVAIFSPRRLKLANLSKIQEQNNFKPVFWKL